MSIKYDEWIPEYIAGQLNDEQLAEFEKALGRNKSLQNELNATETALEAYAVATGKELNDVGLQNRIWEKLNANNSTTANPSMSSDDFNDEYPSVAEEFTIGNFMRSYIGIAASVVLLMSLIGNIYLANEAKYQKSNFLSTLEEKSLLQERLNQVSSTSDLFAQEVALLKNPNMKVCKLISSERGHNNSLLLAIDMAKDMQVMVMSPDLPSKPTGHSYQLWAISATGEIVCMGTFDSEKKIYTMKKLPFNPKEFGVTMEEGEFGMPQPTSEYLVRGI